MIKYLVIAILVSVGSANAKVLNPAAPTVGEAEVGAATVGSYNSALPASPATAVAPAVAAAPAKVAQQVSTIEKVQSWVSSKWQNFFGKQDKPAVAVQNPSAPRVPASVPGPTVAPVGVTSQVSQEQQDAEVLARVPVVQGKVNNKGIVAIDIPTSAAIPRLDLPSESKISASDYALDTRLQKLKDKFLIHQLYTPDLLKEGDLAKLTQPPKAAEAPKVWKPVAFEPKGRVPRDKADAINPAISAEAAFALQEIKPLSASELRLMSGLLMLQRDNQCAPALGLFHRLSKDKGFEVEGNYFYSMCSQKLGYTSDYLDGSIFVLRSQDPYYSNRVVRSLPAEVPYEYFVQLGEALHKVAGNSEIMKFPNEAAAQNVSFLMATYGAFIGNYNMTAQYADKVRPSHSRYVAAQFLKALALFQQGDRETSLKLQEQLLQKISQVKDEAEFYGIASLNLARMYFQSKRYKEANAVFVKINKDHSLWLQGLTEMGWSQLMSSDFEGAIGNMYSIQSPYFTNVYKPESFVVRTIGYLNLCQYGDAYRALTRLEKEYRPVLEQLTAYQGSKKTGAEYYSTVRKFFQNRDPKVAEFDGLPQSVIREVARQKDFLNWQKSFNRQIDDKVAPDKLNAEIEKVQRRAQGMLAQSEKSIRDLELKIKQAKLQNSAQMISQHEDSIRRERNSIEGLVFNLEIMADALKAMPQFYAEAKSLHDKRVSRLRSQLEKVVMERTMRIKDQLALILDNNELLRYEVFAGSGENIRYLVGGGEKGNRVPASVLPQSKSLNWNFDGEYWEDEIGHYRSSLKNNCPKQQVRSTASAGKE